MIENIGDLFSKIILCQTSDSSGMNVFQVKNRLWYFCLFLKLIEFYKVENKKLTTIEKQPEYKAVKL